MNAISTRYEGKMIIFVLLLDFSYYAYGRYSGKDKNLSFFLPEFLRDTALWIALERITVGAVGKIWRSRCSPFCVDVLLKEEPLKCLGSRFFDYLDSLRNVSLRSLANIIRMSGWFEALITEILCMFVLVLGFVFHREITMGLMTLDCSSNFIKIFICCVIPKFFVVEFGMMLFDLIENLLMHSRRPYNLCIVFDFSKFDAVFSI